jgi:peptide/nickel transport system permease protein
MDESKKKKEYLKKLEKRKLKKSQEYKALAFSTGITLVFALLFGFFGYSFITGEVRVIPLIIAAAFLAEGLAQGLILRKMRAQILCQRPVSTAIRLSGLLLIIFICTGNIFAAAAGFTLIKKSRTLEYTMTIYALITTVFVMMVSALNLFKDYVSNSFMLGMGLLTAMIVFYLLTFFLIHLWERDGAVDKKLLPVAVLLMITSASGNIFALVAGLLIISHYRHQRQERSIEWIDIFDRLFRNNMAVVGMLVVIILLSLSIVSTLTFDYGIAIDNDYSALLQPISLKYPFGTDNYGRCVFTRIVFGARISLIVGLCVTFVPMVAGGVLGAAAGYFGKRTDNTIMRFLDILYAVPDILLAISIIAAFGANLVNLVAALSIGTIAVYARTVRATVLGLCNSEFVEAARASGAKDWNIIFHHIIPNSMAPIIVRMTMGIGTAVLSTSSLSYLGLGVEPYIPEWGNVLNIGSKYLETNPYLAIFPGLAIIILVLAFNFFGDGLRDALDPKLK